MSEHQAGPPALSTDPAHAEVEVLSLPKLSAQKRRFIEEFLTDYDHVGAARRSGYKNPERQGLALLREPDVLAHITARQEELVAGARLNQARIRNEVMALAFSDIGHYVATDDDGKIIGFDLTKGDSRAISGVKIYEGADGKQRVEFKLHPKLEPLRLLGRDVGLFRDDVQAPNAHIHFHFDLSAERQ